MPSDAGAARDVRSRAGAARGRLRHVPQSSHAGVAGARRPDLRRMPCPSGYPDAVPSWSSSGGGWGLRGLPSRARLFRGGRELRRLPRRHPRRRQAAG